VRSAEVLLMVILGGAGTLVGPAIGATLIVLLQNLISTYTERWVTVLGVIYVLVALLAPNGLAGLIAGMRKERSQA
jgi:branched-chain amino acid transport system permease protein